MFGRAPRGMKYDILLLRILLGDQLNSLGALKTDLMHKWHMETFPWWKAFIGEVFIKTHINLHLWLLATPSVHFQSPAGHNQSERLITFLGHHEMLSWLGNIFRLFSKIRFRSVVKSYLCIARKPMQISGMVSMCRTVTRLSQSMITSNFEMLSLPYR